MLGHTRNKRLRCVQSGSKSVSAGRRVVTRGGTARNVTESRANGGRCGVAMRARRKATGDPQWNLLSVATVGKAGYTGR